MADHRRRPGRPAVISFLSALAIIAVAALSSGHAAGASSTGPPPKHLAGAGIRPSAAGELRPGTRVVATFTGVRLFANRRTGFAVTDLQYAGNATYPLATANGGRTWRTAGPALHLPAAQAPLAVDQAGVAGSRTWFAWCAACNTVIDATSDGGRRWWRTFMPGNVLSVVGGPSARNGLSAVVEGGARGARVWVYTSRDGRRWTFDHSLSAVA
jgi:hypothetical protein